MNTFLNKWNSLAKPKRKTIKVVLGALAGSAAGFAYYSFVGCSTGACPITSDPIISTGWGALIGVVATL